MTAISQKVPATPLAPVSSNTVTKHPPKVLNEMKKALEGRKHAVLASIETYKESLLEIKDEKEEGSHLMKEELSSLLGYEEKRLSEITDALIRIENETYGICEKTKQLIPWERLIACPTATTCV